MSAQWDFVASGLVALGNPPPTGHVDLEPCRDDPRSFLERLTAGSEGRRVISQAEVHEMLAARKHCVCRRFYKELPRLKGSERYKDLLGQQILIAVYVYIILYNIECRCAFVYIY